MVDHLFRLEDVVYTRGGEIVLDHLTAEIPLGASCVVGPSGSGKSSMLRLLNRLADPDQGSISYEGVDVRSLDVLALRREVCLVPQLPALLDGTVYDNVLYGVHLAGRDAEPDRALELAGLDPSFGNREAKRLSVGEQQRVMLARALALEPTVLLLDEPTSALDQRATEAVERALQGLRDRSEVSCVLVTHDPAQATRMADWQLRLEPGGRIADRAAAS